MTSRIDPRAAMTRPVDRTPVVPDREAFGPLFAIFVSAWPKDEKTPTAPTLDLWVRQLAGIDHDVLIEAAGLAVSSCTWWPSLAEFLTIVDAVKVRRRRAHDREIHDAALPEPRDLALNLAAVRGIRREQLGKKPSDPTPDEYPVVQEPPVTGGA